MNVDRPALTALALFGLLGLAFAVFGLGMLRNPPFPSDAPKPKVEYGPNNPETLPAPRELVTSSSIHSFMIDAAGLSIEEIEQKAAYFEKELLSVARPCTVFTRIRPGECYLTVAIPKGSEAEQAAGNLAHFILAQPNFGLVLHGNVIDARSCAIMFIFVKNSGQHTLLQISDILEKIVRPRLEKIPGVIATQLRGESKRQLQVLVSPDKLRAYDLSLADVADAIEKGKITSTIDAVKNLETLAVAAKNGTPIFLRDIAKVVEAAKTTNPAGIEEQRAVLLGVFVKPDANVGEVAVAVRAQLGTIDLPPEMKAEIVVDATRTNAADVILDIESPAGTSAEAVEKVVQQMIAACRKQLPKEEVAVILNLGHVDANESHIRWLFSLASKRSLSEDEIIKRIRAATVEFPGVRTRVLPLPSSPLPQRAEFPVRVRIVGDDLDVLANAAREIVRRAGESAGLTDIGASGQERLPTLRVIPDRENAARFGITVRDITEAYETAKGLKSVAIKGGSIALSFGERPLTAENIRDLPIRTKDGKSVPLGQVAKLETVESLTMLERFNGQRCITITANPAPGTSLEMVKANLRKIANEKLPANCKVIED